MAFFYMIIIETVVVIIIVVVTVVIVIVVVSVSRSDWWWLEMYDVVVLCGALVLRSRLCAGEVSWGNGGDKASCWQVRDMRY